MHIHTYIHIHICTQPVASVFADVYVGVKTHLCNIHSCPCTSAQNTCKVHVTLTTKKCTYIYTYTHMHTHTHAHENTCAFMPLSTRWITDTKTHNLCTNMHTHTHTHVYKRIDVQLYTHMHIYTYVHVHTHTHIHIYKHTHTKCIHKRTQARLERQRSSERARSRWRPGKICTSLSFDAIKPDFAPPMQGLHCTHVLQHQYHSSGATESQYASTQESKPENDQSDCSRETKGQWKTTNPRKQPITQITTARRPDNTRSSALVRSQTTKFMVNSCWRLRSRWSEKRITFPPFSRRFSNLYEKCWLTSLKHGWGPLC